MYRFAEFFALKAIRSVVRHVWKMTEVKEKWIWTRRSRRLNSSRLVRRIPNPQNEIFHLKSSFFVCFSIHFGAQLMPFVDFFQKLSKLMFVCLRNKTLLVKSIASAHKKTSPHFKIVVDMRQSVLSVSFFWTFGVCKNIGPLLTLLSLPTLLSSFDRPFGTFLAFLALFGLFGTFWPIRSLWPFHPCMSTDRRTSHFWPSCLNNATREMDCGKNQMNERNECVRYMYVSMWGTSSCQFHQHFTRGFFCTQVLRVAFLYSKSRLMWSLWARLKW